MPTPNAVREAILARFVNGWTEDDVPYTFDNEEYDPLVDPENVPDEYVELTIQHVSSEQASLGQSPNRRFDRGFNIRADIRVALNDGLQRADELGQIVVGIFEAVTFSGIWCFASLVQEIGSEGRWYLYRVDTPGGYDEVK